MPYIDLIPSPGLLLTKPAVSDSSPTSAPIVIFDLSLRPGWEACCLQFKVRNVGPTGVAGDKLTIVYSCSGSKTSAEPIATNGGYVEMTLTPDTDGVVYSNTAPIPLKGKVLNIWIRHGDWSMNRYIECTAVRFKLKDESADPILVPPLITMAYMQQTDPMGWHPPGWTGPYGFDTQLPPGPVPLTINLRTYVTNNTKKVYSPPVVINMDPADYDIAEPDYYTIVIVASSSMPVEKLEGNCPELGYTQETVMAFDAEAPGGLGPEYHYYNGWMYFSP